MQARNLLNLIWVAMSWMVVSGWAQAGVVGFGSGANQFSMEFVPIGSPGNLPDTTGSPNPTGAVSYTFEMGKFEVSRDMIIKASTEGSLGITLQDMSFFGGNGVDRPATGVNWNEAARFVNWLNTSQGYSPAYKFALQPGDVGYNANADILLWDAFDPGFQPANPFRNSLANFVLPNFDEWYKAAYYDPALNGGLGGYYDFPTGSDSAPAASGGGTAAGTAVYGQPAFQGPADIMLAGGLSPFGTMGQGGNVDEWQETEADLVNNSSSSARGVRGGFWFETSSLLSSSSRNSDSPAIEFVDVGFRVASLSSPAVVPEPGSLAIWGLLGLGGLLYRRRGRK